MVIRGSPRASIAKDEPPMKPVVNAKREHRIMGNHALVLEKHTAVRKGRLHDGKSWSTARTCAGARTIWSSTLRFHRRRGRREIIAWRAVANAGISASDVRDKMLGAVEKRPQQPEHRTLSSISRTTVRLIQHGRPGYLPRRSN
jgi:hypothetical protein